MKGTLQFVLLFHEVGAPGGWGLTPREIFDNVMTVVQNRNTQLKNGANLAVLYCSVSAGVPIIGFSPAMIRQIDLFREQIERLTMANSRFQIMPKTSLIQRHAIMVMLWQPHILMELAYIPAQLFERNPGLKGGLRITKVKHFRKTDIDRQGKSMEGVQMIQLEGNAEFLQSLQLFP